jgi:V8-like Glu-specific endopeptidase
VQSADPNFDLALIKLNAEVPAPGRPLAPAPLADNDLLQFPVRAYGFPLGDPHLYGGQGTCVGVAGQRMFYDADVAEGESGGPVISLQPTGPFLVGVHRAGPGETPAAYGQTNGGVRLTPEAVTWMGDLDAQL